MCCAVLCVCRRVQPEHRIAAMEQHQDEMQELHEQEETAATEAAAAAQKAAHAAAMEAANLDGTLYTARHVCCTCANS